jgi:hypothetical protein
MWLHTTTNYQYRKGTSTRQALLRLYREGGVRRCVCVCVYVCVCVCVCVCLCLMIEVGEVGGFCDECLSERRVAHAGRFYRGISFALVQAPLVRFGATAANDGVIALMSSHPG